MTEIGWENRVQGSCLQEGAILTIIKHDLNTIAVAMRWFRGLSKIFVDFLVSSRAVFTQLTCRVIRALCTVLYSRGCITGSDLLNCDLQFKADKQGKRHLLNCSVSFTCSLLASVILAVSSNSIKTHHILYNGGQHKTVHGKSVTSAPADP